MATEVERGQHCREQTYKELTTLASAMRALRAERCEVATSLGRFCRPGPEVQATQRRKRKTQTHALWHGWLALQRGIGRMVRREDSLRYHEEIQDPITRQRCKEKAQELDADAVLGHRH